MYYFSFSVISDMDEPTNSLLCAQNLCTLDVVCLLLTGQAVSNVFNDTMVLVSTGEHVKEPKGVQRRSDIGFMSLLEHYKACQVN